MAHFTKNGVPMSAPLAHILDNCIANGFVLKPLAYGVRIMGTDVVASDHWRGLYLCKSSGRGLDRLEADGAFLMPADKSQWRACVQRMANEGDESMAQAKALLGIAKRAGYFLPDFAEASDEAESSVADSEVPVEAEPASEPEVEVSDEPKPESKRQRRKKSKGKGKSEQADALDDALNAID